MVPTLKPGDWILARRSGRAEVGQLVVLEHPDRPGLLLVKRVHRVQPDGFWVLGDQADASTDSRHFGAVARVVGPAIWRVRPWGPVGRAPSKGTGNAPDDRSDRRPLDR